MMIMKGQQMKVLDFDYSEEEKAKAEVHRLQTQEIRDIMEFKQLAWNDEEKICSASTAISVQIASSAANSKMRR